MELDEGASLSGDSPRGRVRVGVRLRRVATSHGLDDRTRENEVNMLRAR